MKLTIPATTANQSPVVLDFQGKPVRFVGTPEKPEWIAADVCDVLGLTNSRKAIADFDEDEKGVTISYTLGGKQEMATVYESGLYRLIFASRKAEAQAFKKWVCNEVLPSIRKFGTYPPPANAEEECDPIIMAYKQGYQIRLKQIEHEKRIAKVEHRADEAHQLADAAMRTAEGNEGWVSVLGYCNRTGRRFSRKELASIGKQLSARMRVRRLSPSKTLHPHLGTVNTYPEDLLKEYFEDPA